MTNLLSIKLQITRLHNSNFVVKTFRPLEKNITKHCINRRFLSHVSKSEEIFNLFNNVFNLFNNVFNLFKNIFNLFKNIFNLFNNLFNLFKTYSTYSKTYSTYSLQFKMRTCVKNKDIFHFKIGKFKEVRKI